MATIISRRKKKHLKNASKRYVSLFVNMRQSQHPRQWVLMTLCESYSARPKKKITLLFCRIRFTFLPYSFFMLRFDRAWKLKWRCLDIQLAIISSDLFNLLALSKLSIIVPPPTTVIKHTLSVMNAQCCHWLNAGKVCDTGWLIEPTIQHLGNNVWFRGKTNKKTLKIKKTYC